MCSIYDICETILQVNILKYYLLRFLLKRVSCVYKISELFLNLYVLFYYFTIIILYSTVIVDMIVCYIFDRVYALIEKLLRRFPTVGRLLLAYMQ